MESVSEVLASGHDVLLKIAVFALVQALVYFILSSSSEIFTKRNNLGRSFSFRPARNISLRRIVAAFSDTPVGSDSRQAGLDEDLKMS
uniref:Uncharacterized protein n=1 Tax=Kalanchoe fedtschenkoi TaxID=63787 RepID=A0A7N0T907_KALFE